MDVQALAYPIFRETSSALPHFHKKLDRKETALSCLTKSTSGDALVMGHSVLHEPELVKETLLRITFFCCSAP